MGVNTTNTPVGDPEVKIGAFFDLDKTLLNGATLLILAPVLYKHKLIDLKTLMRAGIAAKVFEKLGANEARMKKMKEVALDIVEGWNHEEVTKLVEGRIEELFQPKIFLEAITLIERHQESGHELFIVSSSPMSLVGPIAEMLGFKLSNVIATELATDPEGNYTNQFVRYVDGGRKPFEMQSIATRSGINLLESYAYSDSVTDAGMLGCVGFPHAINPDPGLKKLAEANGWPITNFDATSEVRQTKVNRAINHPRAPQVGAGAAALITTLTFTRYLLSRANQVTPLNLPSP